MVRELIASHRLRVTAITAFELRVGADFCSVEMTSFGCCAREPFRSIPVAHWAQANWPQRFEQPAKTFGSPTACGPGFASLRLFDLTS
ncbi:hypothetical protein [Mycobacterium conspicuum]|jgi:hypothetical protein|uniref:hypothetical protein n=1 Tax=Mycobacterium conspicuum TaxID=44010 RepID=UPI00111C1FCD|nr:hypothetical protein [Mycobacterium conspicuum]